MKENKINQKNEAKYFGVFQPRNEAKRPLDKPSGWLYTVFVH